MIVERKNQNIPKLDCTCGEIKESKINYYFSLTNGVSVSLCVFHEKGKKTLNVSSYSEVLGTIDVLQITQVSHFSLYRFS